MTNKKTDVGEEKSLAVKPVGTMVESNPSMLLKLAVEKDLDVVKLEKLMELQERWDKRQAEKDFFVSLSKFQAQCPVVVKSLLVRDKDKNPRYKYAPLDKIIIIVGPALQENGFSYTFNVQYIATGRAKNRKGIEVETGVQDVTCTARHIGGHSETASFRSPVDINAYMTEVQQHGSARTFGMRYAFCQVFGIMTGDSDTDGIPQDDANDGFQQQTGTKPRKDPEQPAKPKVTPVKPKFSTGSKEVTRKEYIDTICKYAKDKGIKIEDVLILLKIDVDFPDMTDAQVLKIWQGICKAEKGLSK